MTGPIPEKTLAEGIWIELTWGANIDVRHNTVTNTSRNGIELLDNSRDPQGNGSLTVEHNTVITPTTGIPVPSPATPSGIVVGWFHNQAGSHDAAINSSTRLAHNFVGPRKCVNRGGCNQ